MAKRQGKTGKKVDPLKRALIIGITGQDGSYLAELLLAKGYEGHDVIWRASTFNTIGSITFIRIQRRRMRGFGCITEIWPTPSGSSILLTAWRRTKSIISPPKAKSKRVSRCPST